eukprot:286116-Rhodomonas_salina.1
MLTLKKVPVQHEYVLNHYHKAMAEIVPQHLHKTVYMHLALVQVPFQLLLDEEEHHDDQLQLDEEEEAKKQEQEAAAAKKVCDIDDVPLQLHINNVTQSAHTQKKPRRCAAKKVCTLQPVTCVVVWVRELTCTCAQEKGKEGGSQHVGTVPVTGASAN